MGEMCGVMWVRCVKVCGEVCGGMWVRCVEVHVCAGCKLILF